MSIEYPFLAPILEKYALHKTSHRFLVGIIGAPASGKSYLAKLLPDKVNEQFGEEIASSFAMDGYHFSNEELHRRGLYPHKGAHFTFDVQQFIEKLIEIKESSTVVSCPIYDRRIENPTTDGHQLKANHRIIFVEGNYLLSRVYPWSLISYLLDYSIFLEVDADIQWERLVERHTRIRKTEAEAIAKIQRTDLPNTDFILQDKDRADFIYRPEANRQNI